MKTLLPHTYFRILESYLIDRTFQVKEENYTSSFYDILGGVLQGWVLGTVLYNIFTADLPQTPGITIATFADDIASLASHDSPEEASRNLQKSFNEVDKWLKNGGLIQALPNPFKSRSAYNAKIAHQSVSVETRYLTATVLNTWGCILTVD